MKRALVLAGGGARGAFQVGAVETLIREGNLDFHLFCGVSVGAINAGFLAQAAIAADPTRSLSNLAVQADRLARFWTGIKDQKELFRRRAGGYAGVSVGKNSLYDATPLRRLLRQAIDSQALCSSGRAMIVGVTSLETGRYHAARNNHGEEDRILDYVIASATTPVYFEPVEITPPGGEGTAPQHLVDGSLIRTTPLGDALTERPDEVYVLNSYPDEIPRRSYQDNLLGTAVCAFDYLDRSIDLVADELHRSHIGNIRFLNGLKDTWERLKRRMPAEARTLLEFRDLEERFQQVHAVPIHQLTPAVELFRNGDALEFAPGRIRAAYEHGRERARQFLAERSEAARRAPRAVSY